jgi:TPP-dependent pyruvate/acetoin dehydrogenase alpha subunit
MAGKVRRRGAAAVVSTGGSLISDAKLKQLYASMLECRMLTERALRQRSADLYSASLGQEAIATGCTIDLQPQDPVALAPHDSIAGLVKGVPLDDIVREMYTRRDKKRSRPAHYLAHNIIPASSSGAHLSAATAVALANQQKKNSNVVIAFACKDTTRLDYWRKALEVAARGSLPVIFVVENNPWAAAKPRKREQDAKLKPRVYGFPVITVDGNDVVAVYRVAYESLERVRQGGGPVLVEGKTYCLHGQTRPPAANSEAWRTERDPLTHMQRYLQAKSLFTARWKNQIVTRFTRQLDAAMQAAKKAQS